MSDIVYRVPARSWDEIEDTADLYRRAFGLDHYPKLRIIEFMEKALDHQLEMFRLEVGEYSTMGNAEGLACPRGSFIRLREDVYEAAIKGQGRARFTAAHELGHHVLHSHSPMARVMPGQRIAQFEHSEAQANHFAAALLMPRAFFDRKDDVETICYRHGVSKSAAKNRFNYLFSKGVI